MYVAWTTVGNHSDADRLAKAAIAQGLAVCVQVDGPITSHYIWQGRQEASEEYRLTFKANDEELKRLEAHVLTNHPYDTPEWIVVLAHHVGEKYLSWANSSSSTLPL
jgi:periplasmic divalent cation tolerance protein